MFPHNEGNPSEPISLAANVQRGFNESGKTPDWIKRFFVALFGAAINVPQNRKNAMTAFFCSRSAIDRAMREQKKRSCLFLFWGSL